MKKYLVIILVALSIVKSAHAETIYISRPEQELYEKQFQIYEIKKASGKSTSLDPAEAIRKLAVQRDRPHEIVETIFKHKKLGDSIELPYELAKNPDYRVSWELIMQKEINESKHYFLKQPELKKYALIIDSPEEVSVSFSTLPTTSKNCAEIIAIKAIIEKEDKIEALQEEQLPWYQKLYNSLIIPLRDELS